MVTPSYLKPGDKVAFIAPARKVTKRELHTAYKILTNWGLQVIDTHLLFEEHHQLAGDTQTRTRQVQQCLDNHELKALFCVRGGFGTSKIIDDLNFDQLIEHPKWLIGFSDITILLCKLFNINMQSIHADVALLLGQKGGEDTSSQLKQILFGQSKQKIKAPHHPLNQLGSTTATAVGGNLSVLVDQIGTNSFPNLENCILFIEDLDEYLYHIDRLITHLDRIRVFSQIKGLVIGYMSDMHDNKIPYGHNTYEIIYQTISKYNIPVAFNIPIGHEANNQPIIIGGEMHLNVQKTGTTFENI
ncbi:LD-carboxypeptidase [Cyclobacteriaceae bacterium]|nr:LD-carboxypeptidase [Cyclobacteriaceae bacterium]